MKIANEAIVELATSILTADANAQGGRTNYLRTLLIATQEELGSKKGQESRAQLVALGTVHDRFYEIVLAAAEPFVPKGTKDRGVVLHSRVNFARTAVSALRGHVKAGGDLAALSPTKTTKSNLMKREGPIRPRTAKRWKDRAEAQSKALMATLMGLADADKTAAFEEIQLILGQLTTQIVELGVVSTKDAAQAVGEHRPLRIGKTLFVPTASQVIQQLARPS